MTKRCDEEEVGSGDRDTVTLQGAPPGELVADKDFSQRRKMKGGEEIFASPLPVACVEEQITNACGWDLSSLSFFKHQTWGRSSG